MPLNPASLIEAFALLETMVKSKSGPINVRRLCSRALFRCFLHELHEAAGFIQETLLTLSCSGSALSVWLAFLCFCAAALSFLFFFFSLSGLIWLAAGESQRRCRPKQPGLKWLCECSVRDSFRDCGEQAHSLLTVETSEGGEGYDVSRRWRGWNHRRLRCVWIWNPFLCSEILDFLFWTHPYIQLAWALQWCKKQ